MTISGHALVVGATGMLRGVTLSLAERGFAVTAIARTGPKLGVLARAAQTMLSGRIYPLAVDYADEARLREGLQAAIQARGPLSLAVVYVAGDAPRAPANIARFVQGRYVHVLANRRTNPARPNPAREQFFARLQHITYQDVILGYFQDEETGETRWLTEDEIVGGVLRAIDAGTRPFIVGTVYPWDARPRAEV